ncbi:MAG: TonB-dependent receptor plug domain-containing protein [Woeseiaceae bacterium]
MRFIAAVALLLVAPTTVAGERLLAFDEVVVTATKRETSIRDVAADVTLLRGTDLRATMTTSLEDTFRFVPGVTHESSGSRFGTEGITIRGIGGNRIALEIDGVPLSDQFDIGNFSNATRNFADAGLIEQVEILRGPASALYGSSAVGGVVALSTLDPRSLSGGDTSGGSASAFYRGRDDSANLRASLALQSDAASLLFSGSFSDGAERQSAALDSPQDTQSYHRDAALIKLVGANRFGHDWQLSAIRQTHDVQSRVTSVLGTGRFSSTTRLEGDDSHRMDILSAEYSFDMAGSTAGLLRIFAAKAEIKQNTLDERAAARSPALVNRDFYYTQRLRGAELNLWRDLELIGWSHRVGVGLEFSETETTELRDGLSTSLTDGSVTNEILGERFPLRDFPITVTQATGAYLSDQLTRGPLSLIVALRFDDNRLRPKADDIYTTDNPGTPVAAL